MTFLPTPRRSVDDREHIPASPNCSVCDDGGIAVPKDRALSAIEATHGLLEIFACAYGYGWHTRVRKDYDR